MMMIMIIEKYCLLVYTSLTTCYLIGLEIVDMRQYLPPKQ